jgi:hypothetical protein
VSRRNNCARRLRGERRRKERGTLRAEGTRKKKQDPEPRNGYNTVSERMYTVAGRAAAR